MTGSVEPIVMPECPACGTAFTPARKNQTYCSRACQKKYSQNAARGSRSGEHKERYELHYERAARLAEMIYTTAPSERLGMMKHIISHIPADAGLRNILTDPTLLKEKRRSDGRENIARAANAYVKKFFGVSIQTYVQWVREGAKIEDHDVTRGPVDHGPVPRLPKKAGGNVRCWHKPLPAGASEEDEGRFTADMERVSIAVAEAQAAVDFHLSDQMQLAANF